MIRKRRTFPGSATYWENRYATGGNSGAGSYGNLAQFKADILNDFVQCNGIQSVIEFGCGDGNQLSLSKYPRYTGFDVSATAIDMCKNRFKGDATKQFYLMSESNSEQMAELVLSLDVIFHLVEDAVYFEYIQKLFRSSIKYVVIYADDVDNETVFHIRSRKFTTYIEKNITDWRLLDHIPNKYQYDEKRPNETSACEFFIYEKMCVKTCSQ